MRRKDTPTHKRANRTNDQIWSRPSADLPTMASEPSADDGPMVDIGFASTIYSQNAKGEMVKISENQAQTAPLEKITLGPWGRSGDDEALQ